MGVGWRITKGAFDVSLAAQRSMSNSILQRSSERQANRGGRAANRGLIGPYDPPPPPQASGYLDYSGLATPNDIQGTTWNFPLGRYVLPRKKWEGREEFGLSTEMANRHTVVYAPTQTGKTTSVIAPWIYAGMRAGYLVVAIDLKGNGDLRAKVSEYAASQEPLPDVGYASFDYTDPSESVSWNWMAELDDESSIEAAAEALVGRDRENDPNREFRLRDLKWMRGLLELVNNSGVPWTVRTLLQLLDNQSRLQLLVNRQLGSRAATRLNDLVSLPADEYYTKVQFITTYLEVLNIDGFVSATRRREFSISELTDEAGLFVITAPISDGRLSAAVTSLFLGQFLNHQFKQFNRSRRPVLLVLDEAPRLKDRLDLSQLMAVSASSGMSVLLALQEVTDFDEKERDVILANCGTHILLHRAGHKTTEFFSQRLGTRIATRQTQSSSFTAREGRTWQSGVQTADVPVLGRAELASPPGGEFSAFISCYELSRKPILVDLTRRDLLRQR